MCVCVCVCACVFIGVCMYVCVQVCVCTGTPCRTRANNSADNSRKVNNISNAISETRTNLNLCGHKCFKNNYRIVQLTKSALQYKNHHITRLDFINKIMRLNERITLY